MRIQHLSAAALCIAAQLTTGLASSTEAQASLLEVGADGVGHVLSVGASDARPAGLQGITLLPIEAMGRTRLTELLPDQARRRDDVPGASRLRLPAERGSLYRFRRSRPGEATIFGCFVVAPEGQARVVLEMPGTGPGGAGDPIPGRIAVDASGRFLLLATSLAAGGDLLEVDLATGAVENRTLALAPLEVGRNALVLLPGWGFALSRQEALRFERLPGAQAEAVPWPARPAWIGPDVVRSADGSSVAFVAGADVSQALVFLCRAQGAVQQVSRRGMRIPGAGFLPEDPTGPALALSSDGSWAAWRAEGSSRECFVRATQAGPAEDVHVTGPAHFDNTLNDTGVIAFVDPDSLVLVVGRERSQGIERGDLFRLDLAPGGGVSASNLSLTSGIRQPPFDYGTFDTRDGLHQVPGPSPAFLLHDDGGAGRLLWTDASGAPVEVLERVSSLDTIEVAGTHLVASVARPPGVDDPLVETLSLVQIPPSGRGAIVVRLPGGSHLSSWVGSPSLGRFAAVLEFAGGGRLGRVDVPGSTGLVISPSFVAYGAATGLSASGAVLATVQVGPDFAAFAWSGLDSRLLRTSRVQTLLLPGL